MGEIAFFGSEKYPWSINSFLVVSIHQYLNMVSPRAQNPRQTSSANNDDIAVQQQGNSALINAKRNFNYLVSPSTAGHQPRLRTRALLRTCRYIGQFIFWRVVRWAKFAAAGALVAIVGATAFGSVVSGVAWIAAPPSIGVGILASVIWGVGKYMARKLHHRWNVSGRDAGQEARERMEENPVRQEGSYGQDIGPRAMPW